MEAPTLRTFLLDYLGQVDPATAAAYARTVLGAMDSPDEWAVALRCLALGDSSPEARALMEMKTGELLRAQAWQKDPSVGGALGHGEGPAHPGEAQLQRPALQAQYVHPYVQLNPGWLHGTVLEPDTAVGSVAGTCQ